MILRVLFFLLILQTTLSSQETERDFFVVSDILIEGTKRTKDYVVLRELEFQKGDTIFIDEELDLWNENEKRLLSTTIFTHVKITRDSNRDIVNQPITIEIQENWFIYPNFIFELADRNFNVWWNEQGKSLDRVNIGGRINWIDVSGHRDRFRL